MQFFDNPNHHRHKSSSLQYVEDPAAHVAEVHTARGMSKRGVPCPAGCGTVFTPK